jgi:hydroxyacyl-ACP dehydratase HTD2-like protein with hotdog domain
VDFQEYVGRREVHTEVLERSPVERMAATLGVPFDVDAPLPATWHWVLFQDWPAPTELGEDGHPRRGGFLPPVNDLPRRMRAGGRLEFSGSLRIADRVTRTRTIQNIKEKAGGSGRLVFVTLRDEFRIAADLVLIEDQEIVYLGEGAAPPVPLDEPALAERLIIEVNPVTLFRYSALTGNSHRIHYDGDYAREVEGHAGVVVHGPLQVTWLASLATARGDTLKTLTFRGRRPAYLVNAPFSAEATREGSSVKLQTRDRRGTICLEATATLQMGRSHASDLSRVGGFVAN